MPAWALLGHLCRPSASRASHPFAGLDSSKHGGSAYPNVDAALKSLEEWSSSAPPSLERFGKVGSKV